MKFSKKNCLSFITSKMGYGTLGGSAICVSDYNVLGFAIEPAPRIKKGFRIRPFVCVYWESDFFVSLSLSGYLKSENEHDVHVWHEGEESWENFQSELDRAELNFLKKYCNPKEVIKYFELNRIVQNQAPKLLAVANLMIVDASSARFHLDEIERLYRATEKRLGAGCDHYKPDFEQAIIVRDLLNSEGQSSALEYLRTRLADFSSRNHFPRANFL